MGHKSLGLLGLGEKSLGQSGDFGLWDSSPRDENSWDWQSRPMPILVYKPIEKSFPGPYYNYLSLTIKLFLSFKNPKTEAGLRISRNDRQQL